MHFSVNLLTLESSFDFDFLSLAVSIAFLLQKSNLRTLWKLIITLDVLPFQFEFGAVLFNSTISLADMNGMQYHSIYFKEFYTWSNIQIASKKKNPNPALFFFQSISFHGWDHQVF